MINNKCVNCRMFIEKKCKGKLIVTKRPCEKLKN